MWSPNYGWLDFFLSDVPQILLRVFMFVVGLASAAFVGIPLLDWWGLLP